MKQTPLLKNVLALLEKSERPVSVPEIISLLANQGLTPNKTTLYRMLEKLVECQQVEMLLLDSRIGYYEIKTHHHHHFQCQSCDTIECVTDPALESQIHELTEKLRAKKLTVAEHHFSLSGTCPKCN